MSVLGGEQQRRVSQLVDLVLKIFLTLESKYFLRYLIESNLVNCHELGDTVQLARPGRPVQRRVARGVRLVHRHPVTGTENICRE